MQAYSCGFCAILRHTGQSSITTSHVWTAHVQANAACIYSGERCATMPEELANHGYVAHCDRVRDAKAYACTLCALTTACKSARGHVVPMGLYNLAMSLNPFPSTADNKIQSWLDTLGPVIPLASRKL